MSGGATSLGRDWFAACREFYRKQAKDRPDDLGAKFEEYFATSRVLATDVTLLLAAKSRDEVSDEHFASKSSELVQQYETFGQVLENAFSETSNFIKSFPKAPPKSEADITDYRDPSFLYGGELFTMNYVLIDFWAIDLMFKHQLMTIQRQHTTADLSELALKQCKMFEAVECCDQGPPGAIIGCQASLGIASLFLPKTQKYIDWSRRKFALIEQKGYIYPAALRQRMSAEWGVDVNHWWLPNDEGYPPVVRSIRDFIEYRARVPADKMDAHVANMSGLFKGLDVDDPANAEIEWEHLDSAVMYESSPEQSQSTHS